MSRRRRGFLKKVGRKIRKGAGRIGRKAVSSFVRNTPAGALGGAIYDTVKGGKKKKFKTLPPVRSLVDNNKKDGTSNLPVPSTGTHAVVNPVLGLFGTGADFNQIVQLGGVLKEFLSFVNAVFPVNKATNEVIASGDWNSWPSDIKGVFQDWWRDSYDMGGYADAPDVQTLYPELQGLVINPIKKVVNEAPKGYTMVTYKGQRVAMLDQLAKTLGLMPKRRAKAPISGTEYRSLKEAGKVIRKLDRMEEEATRIAKYNSKTRRRTG